MHIIVHAQFICMSCHNQISLTAQIPWHFQVSRNSRWVVYPCENSLKQFCLRQNIAPAVTRFSCFSQSQSISAACPPRQQLDIIAVFHSQQIPWQRKCIQLCDIKQIARKLLWEHTYAYICIHVICMLMYAYEHDVILINEYAVSYTHLTLPTKRIV